MKFLWISFNISEPIGKMIFSQLSLLQLWHHITFICISKWLPPYQKFFHFECKYFENQGWYWKTVNGILSYFIRSYIWAQHVFWVNFPFNCTRTFDWSCAFFFDVQLYITSSMALSWRSLFRFISQLGEINFCSRQIPSGHKSCEHEWLNLNLLYCIRVAPRKTDSHREQFHVLNFFRIARTFNFNLVK